MEAPQREPNTRCVAGGMSAKFPAKRKKHDPVAARNDTYRKTHSEIVSKELLVKGTLEEALRGYARCSRAWRRVRPTKEALKPIYREIAGIRSHRKQGEVT